MAVTPKDEFDRKDDFDRKVALTALAPHLPEDLLSRALEVAMAIASDDSRAEVLVALGQHYPEDLLSKALESLLAITNVESELGDPCTIPETQPDLGGEGTEGDGRHRRRARHGGGSWRVLPPNSHQPCSPRQWNVPATCTTGGKVSKRCQCWLLGFPSRSDPRCCKQH